MRKWKIDNIPTQTLSMKYLKQILTPKQLEALLKKYMKAKQATLEARMKKPKNASIAEEPEK